MFPCLQRGADDSLLDELACNNTDKVSYNNLWSNGSVEVFARTQPILLPLDPHQRLRTLVVISDGGGGVEICVAPGCSKGHLSSLF